MGVKHENRPSEDLLINDYAAVEALGLFR